MLQDPDLPAAAAPAPTKNAWPEGLHIRAQSLDDLHGLAVLQSLPGVRFGTLRPPYPKLTDVETYLKAEAAADGVSLVAVMDGKIVSAAGFSRLKGRRNHTAQCGIGVHDAYTGRGIGRAMMSELLDAADNWMNILKMELTVFIDNLAAIRLYEQLGFEKEGTIRAFAYRDGRYVDALMMARLR